MGFITLTSFPFADAPAQAWLRFSEEQSADRIVGHPAAYGAWGADLVFGHVGGGGPKVKTQQVWPVPSGPL